MHVEELPVNIFAIGILVGIDDEIGLLDESCYVNFKDEKEHVFSNLDVHIPWLARCKQDKVNNLISLSKLKQVDLK